MGVSAEQHRCDGQSQLARASAVRMLAQRLETPEHRRAPGERAGIYCVVRRRDHERRLAHEQSGEQAPGRRQGEALAEREGEEPHRGKVQEGEEIVRRDERQHPEDQPRERMEERSRALGVEGEAKGIVGSPEPPGALECLDVSGLQRKTVQDGVAVQDRRLPPPQRDDRPNRKDDKGEQQQGFASALRDRSVPAHRVTEVSRHPWLRGFEGRCRPGASSPRVRELSTSCPSFAR